MHSNQKKIYFASDFHLGIPEHALSLERERKLVAWLNSIKDEAGAIFLMGDLFDFWFEYHTVVPRGYTRLMGTLASITDSGIPVHLFRGNHDMWAFRYLQEELGIRLHREAEFFQFHGKRFYLAHGDGLGPGDHGYKLIRRIFACRLNQWLFNWLHPDLGIPLALFWSRKSRYASLRKDLSMEQRTLKMINDRITIHSRNILRANPDVSFLIYGHYHLPMDMKIADNARQIVLGDWLTHFSYAVFDGDNLEIRYF